MVGSKTFCEFFAGIGLVWEALKASGWDCVFSNDIDPKKKQVFESHFGYSGHFHLGDVWETDEILSHIDGAPFLATASFPCTDLSLAGHWRGFAGKESSTYFGFLKVLDGMAEKKPSLVMLENVTGFLTSNGGTDFPRAVLALAELGYWMDAFIVDARYFVPQSRPRLFVIGVHDRVRSPLLIKDTRGFFNSTAWKDAMEESGELRPPSLIRIIEKTELPTGWFTVPMKLPAPIPHDLSEIIDQDDAQDWWDVDRTRNHYEMMHDYHRVRIDELVKSNATFIGTIYRRTRAGKVRAEIRFDGIAGCLRTTKGGSARQIVCVVKEKKLRMRWMTPREYARLQGAGNYKLKGKSDNQNMFGLGDAVCVPVVEWIDRTVLTPIYESSIITKEESQTLVAALPTGNSVRF